MVHLRYSRGALFEWLSLMEFGPEVVHSSAMMLRCFLLKTKLSVWPRAKARSHDLSVEKAYPSVDFVTFSNQWANNSNNNVKAKHDWIVMTWSGKLKLRSKTEKESDEIIQKPENYFRKIFVIFTYAFIDLDNKSHRDRKSWNAKDRKETEHLAEDWHLPLEQQIT